MGKSNGSTTNAFGRQGGALCKLVVLILLALSLPLFYQVIMLTSITSIQSSRSSQPPESIHQTGKDPKRPKIAVMSSFVPNGNVRPPPRLKDDYFDHIVTKACYSYMWGYDFIFNTTHGFDDTYPKWRWIEYGTWHRVPHVASRIDDYDWILYTDTDVAIKDVTRPIESFLNEFALRGKDNVQLFLPEDFYLRDIFVFSAFAFLIRSSDYGRRILKHWDDFARGVCERGNLNLTADHPYNWLYSDQPGLWYAMMRSYIDFYPDRVAGNNYPRCNESTGVLNSRNPGHNPGWNVYFKAIENLTKGSTGKELAGVPDDQPYIWTSRSNGAKGGLAVQTNWGRKPKKEEIEGAFMLHMKNATAFPQEMKDDLAYCKEKLGCYAHYGDDGNFKIGCRDTVYSH